MVALWLLSFWYSGMLRIQCLPPRVSISEILSISEGRGMGNGSTAFQEARYPCSPLESDVLSSCINRGSELEDESDVAVVRGGSDWEISAGR